jgi:hypothetical protein
MAYDDRRARRIANTGAKSDSAQLLDEHLGARTLFRGSFGRNRTTTAKRDHPLNGRIEPAIDMLHDRIEIRSDGSRAPRPTFSPRSSCCQPVISPFPLK